MNIHTNEASGSSHFNNKNDISKVLSILINHLRQEHNFTQDQINSLLKTDKEEIMIPVSIFNNKLGCLETITKYLVEIIKLKNSDVAGLLNRNARTIWSTYNKSIKKYPSKFILKKDETFFIPSSKFRNRTFSTLETAVRYLKENYALSFHDVALLLKRDDSTIWTVYNRAKKKETQ